MNVAGSNPNPNKRRKSSGSGQSSGKSKTKSGSDAPSASSVNEYGRIKLDQHIRSVLSHPLALALFLAFHDTAQLKEDWPPWMKSFFNLEDDCSKLPAGIVEDVVKTRSTKRQKLIRQQLEEQHLTNTNSRGDAGILKESVNEWIEEPKLNEKNLTKTMTIKINEKYEHTSMRALREVPLKAKDSTGNADILLVKKKENESEQEECTPNMLIEVGRHGEDWFRKLDQAIKYLKIMCQAQDQDRYNFKKPMLLAIITLEKQSKEDDKCDVRIGVFLCSPKLSQSNTSDDKFRMSLLWHSKAESMKEASKLFDKMLAMAKEFGEKRDKFEPGDVPEYTYFSSNCCRINNDVLRMYDNRFRKTLRSAIVYEEWKSLMDPNRDKDNTWQVLTWEGVGELTDWFQPSADLKIIATPYRKGKHFATKPTDFLPIMDHLQALHDDGFVHGDIRAYNMVFGDRDDSNTPVGWLIDFDFGGKVGEVFYPRGYKRALEDGRRFGEEKQKIEKWHDWDAVAYIIFSLHSYDKPSSLTLEERKEFLVTADDLERAFCLKTGDTVTDEYFTVEIQKLKKFLDDIENCGWQVSPHPRFKDDIERGENVTRGTCLQATGSPLQKK